MAVGGRCLCLPAAEKANAVVQALLFVYNILLLIRLSLCLFWYVDSLARARILDIFGQMRILCVRCDTSTPPWWWNLGPATFFGYRSSCETPKETVLAHRIPLCGFASTLLVALGTLIDFLGVY